MGRRILTSVLSTVSIDKILLSCSCKASAGTVGPT